MPYRSLVKPKNLAKIFFGALSFYIPCVPQASMLLLRKSLIFYHIYLFERRYTVSSNSQTDNTKTYQVHTTHQYTRDLNSGIILIIKHILQTNNNIAIIYLQETGDKKLSNTTQKENRDRNSHSTSEADNTTRNILRPQHIY